MKLQIENKNPLIEELSNLNLITESDLEIINDKTRDGEQKVLRDKNTGVIILEKYLTNNDYYEKNTSASPDDLFFASHGYFIDDHLRLIEHRNIISKAKKIVDVGCEWGGFIKLVSQEHSRVVGCEPNRKCQEHIEKNLKLDCFSDVKDLPQHTFDLVTLFHVLEHVPFQLTFLKSVAELLTAEGRIIVEIPHANDFLLSGSNLKAYRDFIFWNEHLVLHTMHSLESMLNAAGLKVISKVYKQRYGFSNHLQWFLNASPGGHKLRKFLNDTQLDQYYKEFLIDKKMTDTIFVIAEKL